MELHSNSNSDLYIVDAFDESKELAERIRVANIFREVVLIHESLLYKRIRLNSRLSRLISVFERMATTYFSVDKLVTKFLLQDVEYEKMFFSCHRLCIRLVRFYFLKHLPQIKYFMFDDGLGSYYGQFDKANFFNTLIKFFLFGKQAVKMKFNTLLYMPELHFDYINDNTRLHQLPKFDSLDYQNVDCYNEIFSYSTKISSRCIFFDSVREEICKSDFAFKEMQRWFDLIEDCIGEKNLIVKKHPRSKTNYSHKCEVYPISRNPFEVDCLNMNISNMILITVASTAVVTPKMLFDKEPVVLLLCNLNNNVYQIKREQENLYYKVKSFYKKQERFMIPNNLDELDKCLKIISTILHGKELNGIFDN